MAEVPGVVESLHAPLTFSAMNYSSVMMHARSLCQEQFSARERESVTSLSDNQPGPLNWGWGSE